MCILLKLEIHTLNSENKPLYVHFYKAFQI